jgi:hypothetical protein
MAYFNDCDLLPVRMLPRMMLADSGVAILLCLSDGGGDSGDDLVQLKYFVSTSSVVTSQVCPIDL